jgi:hypothetical protein
VYLIGTLSVDNPLNTSRISGWSLILKIALPLIECISLAMTDHRGTPQRFSMQIPAVSKAAAEEVARITIKRRSRIPPREIHYIQA